MIAIYVLNDFCVAAVNSCDTLKEYVLVSSEDELKDLIGQVKKYPLLVCVLPESKGDDRGFDNYAERNSGLFYVIAPMRETFTKQERVNLWSSTQNAMKDFKLFIRGQMIKGDFFEMLKDADMEGRDQQPEFNLMGCSGWSLNFMYSTGGM